MEVKMEKNEDIFSKGIGNKEGAKSLSAKPVVVQGKFTEFIYKKGTADVDKPKSKPVGTKLVLICKHPDREEPVKISEAVTIVGKSVKTSTLWVNIDEDGNIQKGSMVALLLDKFQVATINDLEGKTVPTELDENKFLAIKAY
jgi:hypothetical protein